MRSGGSEAARVGTARRDRVVGGASLLRRAATWSGCTAVIDVASQCGSLQPERAKRHIDRMGVLSNWPRNRLLLALPSSNLSQLMPELEHFRCQREQVLMDADSSLDYVFLPHSLVVSVGAVYADGSIIEMATIGREGCTAVQAIFGAKSSSSWFLVQIPGDAAKMSRAAFTRAMASMPSFRRLMFAYVQALLEQVLVSVACTGAHSLTERLARWLLMMRDCGDDDTLQITQHLLGEMLGVQRPSITNAARELERASLIERGRRQVTILDRQGLMKASYECYQMVGERVAFYLPNTYAQGNRPSR